MALKVLDGFTSHSLALDAVSSLLMEIISNGLRCFWDHVGWEAAHLTNYRGRK
jgi:hypothetical protein